jgi:putative copper resistance protein D
MELAVIAARLVQFTAGAALFGTPLFLIYGMRSAGADALRWPRPLVVASAAVLLAGALLSLFAQTAAMAGDPAAAFDPETLATVLTGTPFGVAIVVRIAATALALVAGLRFAAARGLWMAMSGLGGVALATFAWSGHGAAEPGLAGQVHAAADILHLLASGVWLGALAALAVLLRPRRAPPSDAELRATHAALAGFAGVGSLSVATLVLTGLVNTWFLVGPSRIFDMADSPYGVLLLIKLGLFVGMLGLAATNRFHLTPGLAMALERGQPSAATADLRNSVLVETAAGFTVLVLVSVLGTLAPVAAQ